MSKLNRQNFKTYLNLLLKIILILFSLYIVIRSQLNHLLIIFVISIAILLCYVTVLKFWVRLNLKLIPFYISIILLGIVFRLDYFAQLHLILKISFLLLISSYVTRSLDQRILKPADPDFKQQSSGPIKLYITATLYYIGILLKYFDSFSFKKKNIKDVLVETIELKEMKMDGQITDLDVQHDSANKIPDRSNLEIMLSFCLIIIFLMFFWLGI